MNKLILFVAFFISNLLIAQSQFEQGMQKAFSLWEENKPSEASAFFERIASAEKNNWLPDYYVALVNVTESFKPENKKNALALIEKAQLFSDNALMKSQSNAEIHILQALIYTALVVQDPMTNGMKYSPKVMEEYTKALALEPENPRAVFGKADYEIGGARWTGADVKVLCKEVERSISLFEKFKPASSFHPKWGLERAKEVLKNCK